jgi:hypothetical protein
MGDRLQEGLCVLKWENEYYDAMVESFVNDFVEVESNDLEKIIVYIDNSEIFLSIPNYGLLTNDQYLISNFDTRAVIPIIMAACAVTIAIAVGVIIGRFDTYIQGLRSSAETLSNDFQCSGEISQESKDNFGNALYDTIMWGALITLSIAIGILFLCLKPYTSVGDWVLTAAISLAIMAVIAAFGATKSDNEYDVSAESEDAIMNTILFLIGKDKEDGAFHHSPIDNLSAALAIFAGILYILLAYPLWLVGATPVAAYSLLLALSGCIIAAVAYESENAVTDAVCCLLGFGLSIISIGLAIREAAKDGPTGSKAAVGLTGAVGFSLGITGICLSILGLAYCK